MEYLLIHIHLTGFFLSLYLSLTRLFRMLSKWDREMLDGKKMSEKKRERQLNWIEM